jgi:hypothetical protein
MNISQASSAETGDQNTALPYTHACCVQIILEICHCTDALRPVGGSGA